jgi:peptidoglycan/LPS O-acetylase OafA/YrhL
MGELKYLTSLRALAAFYVFIFHMYLAGAMNYMPKITGNILAQGALGVNIFFVLSGFLLTYSHLKDFTPSQTPRVNYYKVFLIKRLARIYPVYLVGIVLTLLVDASLRALPTDLPLVLLLDSTMLKSWVPPLAMTWFGGGGWSVSTELFFYLVFPLLLPALLLITKRASLFALLGVFIILAAMPGLLHNFAFGPPTGLSWQLSYPFPPARVSEFIAGMITALLVYRFNWRVSVAVMLGAVAVAVLYLMKFGGLLQGYVAHNLVVLPAIVATVGCLARSPQTILLGWLGSSVMTYAGRISYSFYILQLVLLTAMDTIWERHTLARTAIWVAPCLFIINLLAAALVYELIEKRMHKAILSRLLPRKLQGTSMLKKPAIAKP